MFGFKKATVLAALSLFLSAAIFHYGEEENDTRELHSSGSSSVSVWKAILNESRLLGKNGRIDRLMLQGKRNLLLSAVHTILSSILKFLFESPLSGKNIKTMSCFAAFGLAGVDFSDTDSHSNWFNDDSVMELYAAGKYYGLDGIREYTNFLYCDDFTGYDQLSDQALFSEITKDSDTCNITYAVKRRASIGDLLFPSDTCYEITAGATARFSLTGDENFILIEKVNIFYPEAYVSSLFGGSNDGAYAERVCSIMEENCGDVWTANEFADQAECQESVEAMPKADGVFVDGRSQGCRWLHSVFAATNDAHCPHISSIPLEDTNGKIKCQDTEQNQPTFVFSAAELSFFEESAINEFGFDETMISIC